MLVKCATKRLGSVRKATAIKSILHLPQSTLYWDILKELAVWRMKQRIVYHKMMRNHHLMHSDDRQIAKQVIKDQQIRGKDKCWYEDVIKVAEQIE